MKLKKGTNRIVILIGKYAVKIPNFINGHLLFLYGCLANYRERWYCKKFKDIEEPRFYAKVCPSVWCSWFGLCQIQRRVDMLKRDLTKSEILQFKDVCTDIKRENFGYYYGRLVCIDYG